MEKDFIYLTYYQAMIFMHEIAGIRKNNPYFNDNIVKSYEEYVINRTAEIVTTYPQIKLKIFPNASKYKISKSLFDYLTRLTSIDVYDKEILENYTIMIKESEKNLLKNLNDNFENASNYNKKSK